MTFSRFDKPGGPTYYKVTITQNGTRIPGERKLFMVGDEVTITKNQFDAIPDAAAEIIENAEEVGGGGGGEALGTILYLDNFNGPGNLTQIGVADSTDAYDKTPGEGEQLVDGEHSLWSVADSRIVDGGAGAFSRSATATPLAIVKQPGLYFADFEASFSSDDPVSIAVELRDQANAGFRTSLIAYGNRVTGLIYAPADNSVLRLTVDYGATATLDWWYGDIQKIS